MTSLPKNKFSYGLNSYSLTKSKDINPKLKTTSIKSFSQAEMISNNTYSTNIPKSGGISANASNKQFINLSIGLNQIENKETSSNKNSDANSSNLNSFRTPGITGKKYKTSKNSPEKCEPDRNTSEEKAKIYHNQNSHLNYFTKKLNSSDNKFIPTENILNKPSHETQLEYLKMKLMNKRKFELKGLPNNLNFTNPLNHINNESGNISSNMSSNTNSNGMSTNNLQKTPINYQIFLKNPLNIKSEKERHKNTSNSVYSISNVNNSSSSALKLSLTKSNINTLEEKHEANVPDNLNKEFSPRNKTKAEEAKKYIDLGAKQDPLLKKENPNSYLNTKNLLSSSNSKCYQNSNIANANHISYLKASDVQINKLMSKISPTAEDLISTFKKKTTSILSQGMKQSITTPTTNKNSRKSSSDKTSDLVNSIKSTVNKMSNGIVISSNVNNNKGLLNRDGNSNSNYNNYLTSNTNSKNIINYIKLKDNNPAERSNQFDLFNSNPSGGESNLVKNIPSAQDKHNLNMQQFISSNNNSSKPQASSKNLENTISNTHTNTTNIISSNISLNKKSSVPFTSTLTGQNSKVNSKTGSKSTSRIDDKIEAIIKKKPDEDPNLFSTNPMITKNKINHTGKISFNLNLKKHSTNTNSPSHFNFLIGGSKGETIKMKEFMKESKKNSMEKNNSTLSKYKDDAVKTKPVSLKFNQSSYLNIGITQPNPSGAHGLSKPNTNTNSKENLGLILNKNTYVKKPYTNTEASSSNYIAKVNLCDKPFSTKYSNTNKILSKVNFLGNDTEASLDNLLNMSTSSVKSTIRESNYYKREAEKISNFIKQFLEKNKEYPQTTIHFYKYGRLLGRGAFGKVNLGLHVTSGRLVAVKSFNKTKLSSDNAKRKIMHEVNLMKHLKHTSIVKIFEMIDTQKYIVIVMEYICGGDLLSFVRKRTKLNEVTAKFIFKQIIETLQYIHSQNIVHRDIKLDNILIDLNNNIKICDFGVGKNIKKGEVMYDQCGTPAYIAPEILINKGYDGFGVDIWSAGVLLYTILSGKVPFKANKMLDLHKIIIGGSFSPVENVSEEAIDLINGILEVNPKKRLNIEQILSHPWLKSCEEINNGKIKTLNKMILFTNAERILLSKTNVDYCNAVKDDLIEVFTLKNLDTLQETENKNIMTRSAILAPYNSSLKYTMDKLHLIPGLFIENAVFKFCGKAKEANRNYELNNNGEIDNGILINLNNNQDDGDDKIKEKEASEDEDFIPYNNFVPGSIKNSVKVSKPASKPISKHVSKPTSPPEYVNEKGENRINNIPSSKEDLHRNSRKNAKDLSISNANTLVIDENIVKILEGFGYKKEYVVRCINNNDLNYATAAYYLLSNSTTE